MSRNKIELTEEQIIKISKLSGLGFSIEKIALSLGISKATLDRRVSEESNIKLAIDQGRTRAIEAVSATAFKMATGGKHPAFTMFWLRCHAGWDDKISTSKGNDEQEIKFHISVSENDMLL